MFLLVAVSVFVFEVKSKIRKEIIVYNEQRNTLIHLISGDENYVISKNEITDDDYSSRIIETTKIKYRLNDPVFLTANLKYEDENLFLDKNLVSFEGKTIQILDGKKKIFHDFAPEFVIGPAADFTDSTQIPGLSCYISTSRHQPQIAAQNLEIHSLVEKGAFREKW